MSLRETALAGETAAAVALPAPRTRGRPKTHLDDELRATVVGKAMELYCSCGFATMRMDDVASACKISKRTIYRIFPSKLDLFRAMVARYRTWMVALPLDADSLPLEEALRRIFLVDRDPEDDRLQPSFLLRVLEDAEATPELGAILLRDGCEQSKVLLADWFRSRKEIGDSNIGDPHSAASVMLNMVFGAIALRPTKLTYWPGGAERSAYLGDCIRYFVNGVK